MQIYNTMTHKKEPFVPQKEGHVSMYACGITAYDLCHIGHARSAVVFDVLARYLRYTGYNVTFVRNFTDVDDKIIAKANKEGCSSKEIAEKYIKTFHEDMDMLGVERADLEPKATEYIEDMLDLCQKLIHKGHAYATPSGDVYFRVRSFEGYGKLSGRSVDDLRSGARVAIGEEKEDPLDFALWKAAKPNEPSWTSPWGEGRPGWHIECSSMVEKTLSLPLDIHGGGQDLIFPHHENEIAQSEAALGKELAKYWVHNGFVQINAEKMSKSLDNFKTIRDILQLQHPEVLRFFLLSKHYRSPIDFTPDSMDEAEKGLRRVYECFAEIDTVLERENWKLGGIPENILNEITELKANFMQALEDDCNSAAAIGHIFAMVRFINRILDDSSLKNKEGTRDILKDMLEQKEIWHKILGLFNAKPDEILLSLRSLHVKRLGLDIEKIESLILKRQEARAQKNFAESDTIRDELNTLGIAVKDTPNGQVWNTKH